MKKAVFLAIVLCLVLGCFSGLARESKNKLTKEELKQFSQEECVEFLKQQGVIIPRESYNELAYSIFLIVLDDPFYSLESSDSEANELTDAIRLTVNLVLGVKTDAGESNKTRYI